MYVAKYEVSIVTDSDGNGVGFTPVVTGKVINVIYTKPASGGYADGVTVAVTGEDSGVSIWFQAAVNASATVAPKQKAHTTAGAESKYAAEGTNVLTDICVAQERVKIAVSSGGDGGTGKFLVIVG